MHVWRSEGRNLDKPEGGEINLSVTARSKASKRMVVWLSPALIMLLPEISKMIILRPSGKVLVSWEAATLLVMV